MATSASNPASRLIARSGGESYREDKTVREVHSTPAQEEALARLEAEGNRVTVVVHPFCCTLRGRNRESAFSALVDVDGPGKFHQPFWIRPNGALEPAKPVYGGMCFGNPTPAHCITRGFCSRRYACND